MALDEARLFQHNTQAEIIEIFRGCAAAGLSVGIFNPTEDASIEELTEAAKWYK